MNLKDLLTQYCDLQEEIKETREKIDKCEKELVKLHEDGEVKDTVKGGAGGIQHFTVHGYPIKRDEQIRKLINTKKSMLDQREFKLLEMTNQIEEFIDKIEVSRMRRIISFRFIDNMSWSDVGKNIGPGNTSEAVRQEFHRFMEKS